MKKTLLIGTLLTAVFSANSAIVYTDITDATLQASGTLAIDFNGDNTADFTFSDNGFGGTIEPYIAFNPDAGFVMIGDFQAGGWDEIQGLTLNTTINGTSNFANNGADGFIDPMWNPGSFPAGNDTYIGATFKLGANVHYGWIRVNWNVNGTFIVRGFAYNDTPNAAINAGAEGGSTASIASEEIAVDFTLKENQIEIRANQSIENISIYNTNGQMINAVSKTNILSIDEAVSGLLIVHIIFKNNETSTFKLFR